MKPSLLLIAALLVGFLASCGEDIETLSTDSSAVDQKRIGDLTFTLQVLNMEDEPQAVFKKGENFMLVLTILRNKSRYHPENTLQDLLWKTTELVAI